jgi:hypothetical protein
MYYRYQAAHEEGGISARLERTRRTPNLKNGFDEAPEAAMETFALEFPAVWSAGCGRLPQSARSLGLLTPQTTFSHDVARVAYDMSLIPLAFT